MDEATAIPRGQVYSHDRYDGIAGRMGYVQDPSRIQKVKYTHDAMIDEILANPSVSQNDLAKKFGYTVPWVSRVMGSDSFQARLHARRDEVVDPFLVATIEERFRGLAMQSLDIIAEKMEATKSVDTAFKALDISSKALGFGARVDTSRGNVQNNFVIQIPGKAANAAEWAEAYNGKPIPVTVEALPMSTTITRDPTIQPSPMKIGGE